jgi:peptidoglycan hydrolase CwlO-like protein
MAADVDQVSLLAEYGSLIAGGLVSILIATMSYLLNRSISTIDDDITELKRGFHGTPETMGVNSKVVALNEQYEDLVKDVDELNVKVESLQAQIVENQQALTDRIITQGEKTSDEFKEIRSQLGEIIGFLKGKE